jgi:hypothetical protein
MKKILLSIFFLTSSFLLSPTLVLAQTPTCNDDKGINTAIGCIPFTDKTEFLKFFLRWAIGIAGGIFLILAGLAAFQIITSSGDPKKAQAGRELLTSAIAGLVFLILSLFFLNAIGVGILGLVQISP